MKLTLKEIYELAKCAGFKVTHGYNSDDMDELEEEICITEEPSKVYDEESKKFFMHEHVAYFPEVCRSEVWPLDDGIEIKED